MLVKDLKPETLSHLLRKIYKEDSATKIDQVSSQLLQILLENSDIEPMRTENSDNLWNSSSAVLITYPDAVFRKGESTLSTLSQLIDKKLGKIAEIVHILPFLKSTSDGGFAVSSHSELDPYFGDWEDINLMSKKNKLMADLVLNHVSSSHVWVQDFIQCNSPGSSYILSPEKTDGWEKVIRPRSSSLFTSLETKNGKKNAWTTFGPDQIDLDWSNPFILVEFLKLIILYLRNGVRWIRLDAVAFIWKEKGTTCLHRDQVHEIIRLLRFLMQVLIKDTVLITETNVPEKENLSYLIAGNEAHLAYNFPLPPLLLEALLSNKSDLLNNWLSSWPDLPSETSFLNFTSSHDGIGVRALEGLMEKDRFHELLVGCEKRGGLISHRKMENGEDSPYELNISWWSAMADEGIDPTYLQLQRFLLSQLFTMALKGVPAFYLQSLLASENDVRTFGKSGQRRDLNRERFDADELFYKLEDPTSNASQILDILKFALTVRSSQPSFHPESPMECHSKGRSDLILISRGKSDEKIWAIHNMTNTKINLSLSNVPFIEGCKNHDKWKDCLSDELFTENNLILPPYNVKWLKKHN